MVEVESPQVEETIFLWEMVALYLTGIYHNFFVGDCTDGAHPQFLVGLLLVLAEMGPPLDTHFSLVPKLSAKVVLLAAVAAAGPHLDYLELRRNDLPSTMLAQIVNLSFHAKLSRTRLRPLLATPMDPPRNHPTKFPPPMIPNPRLQHLDLINLWVPMQE